MVAEEVGPPCVDDNRRKALSCIVDWRADGKCQHHCPIRLGQLISSPRVRKAAGPFVLLRAMTYGSTFQNNQPAGGGWA